MGRNKQDETTDAAANMQAEQSVTESVVQSLTLETPKQLLHLHCKRSMTTKSTHSVDGRDATFRLGDAMENE
ncbi:hypothetical protein T02_4724 [Trichinella nativa]|uniref:Uncharacterized protein n=1 Tax=Trichinella nativa TaxID=6335 RepID=A0A0V1LE89_9BILA|nr:hypothetical protein T02_4724 [Trichinella nativa]